MRLELTDLQFRTIATAWRRGTESGNELEPYRQAISAYLDIIELNGYQIAPQIPTDEMLSAAWRAPIPAVYIDSISGQAKLRIKTEWQAMLAVLNASK